MEKWLRISMNTFQHFSIDHKLKLLKTYLHSTFSLCFQIRYKTFEINYNITNANYISQIMEFHIHKKLNLIVVKKLNINF